MTDTFYSESDKKELVELYVIYQSYYCIIVINIIIIINKELPNKWSWITLYL